ncbi:MAG: hypothetical protein QF515_17090 [Pseudomonadales bacterium]|jgi:hypothetical protein|nr:hypothetical protein [Pseudomonadales bacterium]MDP6471779.1 hypothetical protein [Pseudomonadales bacterium]MDP6828807.1 hypothetical protein [Pseudomonadales bacterium]|tara:strand:- start:2969 stop:3097 length:129 start_codon:yes stop_codon:yes gene_type:complete
MAEIARLRDQLNEAPESERRPIRRKPAVLQQKLAVRVESFGR